LKVKIKKLGFILLSLIILGGLFILNGNEEEPIKIAVSSDEETIDSQVSNLGARSPWFLLFDEQGSLTNTLENPYRNQRQAGVKCAEFLKNQNVTVFVAGNVGPKMGAALESMGIAFIPFSGSVKEGVNQVLKKNPSAYKGL
jgi:predicted Fe-Mo cluster-binding NifX family protein